MKNYTASQMTEMLEAFDEINLIYRATCIKSTPILITQENVDSFNDDDEDPNPEYINPIKDLVGYMIYVKTDGDHKNDGQMVEYTFTFINPTGEKTKFSTEMCLMVGWNCCDDVNIK
jgi:hypothetical protein